MPDAVSPPLSGMTVVVGREDPGALRELLAEQGATMFHVPLIVTADPEDGGRALRAELDTLDRYTWLVVSSVHGADRVGAAAAGVPGVRLAAVGRTTADRLAELAGRPVALVPTTQTANALAAELTEVLTPADRVLVAGADRSAGRLETDLLEAGCDVVSVVAYRTVLRVPDATTVDEIMGSADALLLTSGSIAESWAKAPGTAGFRGPIVAIGPSTAAVAARAGVPVTAVAEQHSLEGLVRALAEVASTGMTNR